jgi:hypothetical protein
MERVPCGEHGVWRGVFSGAGGHWWGHCPELWVFERVVGHPDRGVDHLPHRLAHQLLRGPVRHGHGPAHTRCRLWLPGINADVVDLRQLHVYLLCVGGRHHGLGHSDAVRLVIAGVLRGGLAGDHPHGDPRHHTHFTVAVVDAAFVAGAVGAALHCRGHQGPAGVCGLHVAGWPHHWRQRVQLAGVRHGSHRRVFIDCSGGRAG